MLDRVFVFVLIVLVTFTMGRSRTSERNSKRKRYSSSDSSSSVTSDSTSASSDSGRSKQRSKHSKKNKKTKTVSTSICDETVIPIFDPNDETLPVEKWVQRVDELSLRYEWESETVVKLVANRLRGMARRWYDLQDGLYEWKFIKKQLVEHFRKPLPFGNLLQIAANYEANTGTSKKLLPKFKGPFRITCVLMNDRYEVQDLREGSRQMKTVVAADKIKPWVAVAEQVE